MEGARVIQGEIELCGFWERPRERATNAPVLSLSLAPLMDAIFPGSSTPQHSISLEKYTSPILTTSRGCALSRMYTVV